MENVAQAERVSLTVKGRHVRWTVRVTLEDGRQVTFLDPMPKAVAIRQAREVVARG